MIALVADTHNQLRPELLADLARAERIVHLGDFCNGEVLARLEEIAPVDAVRGNNDFGPWAEALPDTAVVELYARTAYLVHDIADLDLEPAEAGIDLVLYGHSHKPADETRDDGVRYLNPGSVGPRRFTLPISYAWMAPDGSIEFVRIPFPN